MKRVYLAFVLCGFLSAPAIADDSKSVSTEAIYACAQITDNNQRLACYDETVGKFQAAELAGEVTTVSRTEVEELEKASFGFSILSLPKSVLPKLGNSKGDSLTRIEHTVASVKTLHFDRLRVTLDNGQVWEQTDDQRIPVSTRKGAEIAEIKKAALGSFKIKLDGGRSFRAKRVK